MKNKLLVLMFTFLISMGICFMPLRKVRADEDIEEPMVEEVLEENENTEEANNIGEKSNAEVWLEKYFGWIVGVPIGTLIAALIEIIALAKKSKAKVEELKETKDSNKFIKEQIEITKEMLENAIKVQSEAMALVNFVKDNSETTLKELERVRVNITDTMNEMNVCFSSGFNFNQEKMQENFKELELLLNRFKSIEEIQKLIALNTKELVCSGTAEKIVKKLEGANDEEV